MALLSTRTVVISICFWFVQLPLLLTLDHPRQIAHGQGDGEINGFQQLHREEVPHHHRQSERERPGSLAVAV